MTHIASKTLHDNHGLTRRQRDMLVFIVEYSDREGVSPSYQEIQEGTGLTSLSRVHHLIGALVQRGWLSKLDGKPRSLTVLRRPVLPASGPQAHMRDRDTILHMLDLTRGAVAALWVMDCPESRREAHAVACDGMQAIADIINKKGSDQ